MAYLEVQLEAPAVITGDDPNRVVSIDYSAIDQANDLAARVSGSNDSSETEKALADSIHNLVAVLSETVRGLHYGRLTVSNYPFEGSEFND